LLVSQKLKISSVIASSGLTLIIFLITNLLGVKGLIDKQLTGSIPAYFMGASFIGMSTKDVLSSIGLAGLAGAFFSIILFNISPLFKGFGGGLGTVACISVLMVTSVAKLINRLKK